jgi:hypothetical protein
MSSGTTENISLPLTQVQILARVASVTAADAAAVLAPVPAIARPIGLAIAFSQSPSAFIRNAKLTRSVGSRSTNVLFYS